MSQARSRSTFADLDRAALDEGVTKLQRILKDLRGFDAKSVHKRQDERLEALQKRVNNVLGDLVGMGSPDYTKHKLKAIDGDLDTTFGDHYSME